MNPPPDLKVSKPERAHDAQALWAELVTPLQHESADIQREVLLWQRWIRYGAAALAMAGAMAWFGETAEAGPILTAAALYIVLVILMAWYLKHSPSRPVFPLLVLVADVAMISAVILLSVPPVDYHRILMLGFLVLQLTLYYFGARLALLSIGLLVSVYVIASFSLPAHIPGPRPEPTAVAFNTVIFLFVAWVLLLTFGGFRKRMNRLRTFCKRVESGDLTWSYDLSDAARPDELTLLARSLDAMRSRLIELIGTDPLTGCLNRRALETRLGREWRHARRRHAFLSLLAIDLDNFKEVNDTRGHPVGDLVLQELAEIMRQTARETDAVARIGGDEFVVVLPDTGWQGAMTFAERLRRNVDEHTFRAQEPLRITVSVGVAHASGSDTLSAEELLEQADRSLYRAKQGGRNRISA